jgi:hypothetical protein
MNLEDPAFGMFCEHGVYRASVLPCTKCNPEPQTPEDRELNDALSALSRSIVKEVRA